MHKVVVIGVGSIGERHVRCFQGTGRASVSIVEINDTLRVAVAGRYGVAAHSSLELALQEKPDVAVVAAPAHLHIPLTSQLVTAGVHVLIEKPLSVSLDGIVELQQRIAERRAVVGLAYVYRAHPVLGAMKDALDADRIGRPLELVAVCGQHFPTYRPAYREIYYARRELGGGAIQDALTHIVNAGEWLIGPVDALVADADHCALAGVAVEDTVHLLTRQRNVLGSYSLNQHQAPNELTLTVIGERGTLRWENHHNRLSWMNVPDTQWHEQQFSPLERDSLFVSQANAFLDAVEGRRPVLCSFDEGVQTLRVNLATLASVDHRCWQTVSAG